MMWSTYAIGTAKGMAACIIVNRKDRAAPGGVVPVLVTAKHVLAGVPHGPYYLAMRMPRPDGKPEVAVLEIAPAWLSRTAYTKHPREDVAALELRIPREMAKRVLLPSFIDEDAIGRRGDEAHPGDPVSLLGFPRVFPGTEGGFAILRGGTVASYAPGASRELENFLVNANVYAGDSGGPVFASNPRGRRPILLGLMTERIGKKSGDVPLAVAINAEVIHETLQLLPRNDPGSFVGSDAESSRRGQTTAQLNGPPAMFLKVVRAKRPSALPIPVAPPRQDWR